MFAHDEARKEHLHRASQPSGWHNLNSNYQLPPPVAHDSHATSFTHRQEHAFDLANGPEAAEEGQHADKRRGDDQHIDSAREQVRAQQLAQEVPIDECNEPQHEHNCAADLCTNVCGMD